MVSGSFRWFLVLVTTVNLQREFGKKENLVLKGLSWCGNTICRYILFYAVTPHFNVEMCLQLYVPLVAATLTPNNKNVNFVCKNL